ncbi:hypothetical protein, partial [Antrihabitans stalactiti]|uniref:hypothetical protein n=1 Tax=Antrihabitans stalactiti TaxID=2584121 RepID=UPI00197F2975
QTTRHNSHLTPTTTPATLSTAAPNVRNYVTATPGELRDGRQARKIMHGRIPMPPPISIA